MLARRITLLAAVALGAWAGSVPVAEATSIIYSGRAFGAQVTIVNPQPNVLMFSDTGQLPPSGGSLSATLATIALGTTLSSHTITASTSGVNGTASSSASQQGVNVFPGQAAAITADLVTAQSQANCGAASGSSTIAGLTFGGQAIVVTGQPNQTVTLGALATLVINEQIFNGSQDITVNALHLTLGTGEQVILSSAHSDVNCVVPTRMSTWSRVKQIYR